MCVHFETHLYQYEGYSYSDIISNNCLFCERGQFTLTPNDSCRTIYTKLWTSVNSPGNRPNSASNVLIHSFTDEWTFLLFPNMLSLVALTELRLQSIRNCRFISGSYVSLIHKMKQVPQLLKSVSWIEEIILFRLLFSTPSLSDHPVSGKRVSFIRSCPNKWNIVQLFSWYNHTTLLL